jgi:GNAT superfamily N-acetyltransferase
MAATLFQPWRSGIIFGVADVPIRSEDAVRVAEVRPATADFDAVLGLAAQVLSQDRYLVSELPAAVESHVLGAFDDGRCVGFLRYVIQVIGADAGRPAVMRDGSPLTEGYVEAFGVEPRSRRRGIGTALQDHAARRCREAGCHQMRSRSPVTSAENYALKVAAGYVLHPSSQNDSYYFLLHL